MLSLLIFITLLLSVEVHGKLTEVKRLLCQNPENKKMVSCKDCNHFELYTEGKIFEKPELVKIA